MISFKQTSTAVGAYKRALRADPCAYCNHPAAVRDHIEPRALGGAERWWNLTGACACCNSKKKDMTLLGFLNWRGAPQHQEVEYGKMILADLRKVGVTLTEDDWAGLL